MCASGQITSNFITQADWRFIWDQITSNLLVYNLQLPYKYDGHHGRDGHPGQNGHHGKDGHHGQAGHLDQIQDGHNGLVMVKICI